MISRTERVNRLIEERRTRFEPLWHAALAKFSDDELLTAAAVLDRMRSMFDAVNDGDH